MISVVVPTLTVRQKAGWTDRCIASYEATMQDVKHEIIVIFDRPACGVAWNEGLAQARGEHIHLTADDIEPIPGWWQAAVNSADHGELPSARILNTDGTLQSCGTDDVEHDEGEEANVARIPFASRTQFDKIGPLFPNQYMGDYLFSHRGREVGYPSVVRRDYCFYHHFAQEGRIDTLDADVSEYFRRGGT